MKVISFVLIFCLTLASSFVYAQEAQPKNEPSVNKPPILVVGKKYEVFGWYGQTRFTQDIIIESANGQEVKGYVVSNVGPATCVGEVVPLTGTINQDGSMLLNANQQGGCGDRSWTIKPAQGDKIEGLLVARLGKFSVIFVQKK